jgi:hypothetical protein
MGTYSDGSMAVALTGSDLEADVIAALVEAAEKEIMAKLQRLNLETTPSPIPTDLEMASVYYTCRNIVMRQRQDGTQPDIDRTGNNYQTVNNDKIVQNYQKMGNAHLTAYVASKGSTLGFAILVGGCHHARYYR